MKTVTWLTQLHEQAQAHRALAARQKDAGHMAAEAGYLDVANDEFSAAEQHVRDAIAIEQEMRA